MILRLALFLLPVLALSACRDEHTWHQNLTMVVETPAGERAGAVLAQRAQDRALALARQMSEVRAIAAEAAEHGVQPDTLDRIIRLAAPRGA